MVRPTSTQSGPKLTVRQRQVLGLIVDASAADGRPPTLREIGRRLGIASTNGVRDHLQALIEKGYIRRDERSARGIHVLRIPDGAPASAADGGRTAAGGPAARSRSGEGGETVAVATDTAAGIVLVPVLGRVAAGRPVLAEQNVEQHIAIDRGMIHDGDVFALRVHGDSMRDAGILDGDYVFVRQQATAQSRDIVVALLGEETTVKRFVPAGDTIRLEPANPDFGPILVRRGDPRLQILGKVSAVLRTIK
jgi:repressor LexA